MTSYIGWKLRLWWDGYTRVGSIEEFLVSAKGFDKPSIAIASRRRELTVTGGIYEYVLMMYCESRDNRQKVAFCEKLVDMRRVARFGDIDDEVHESIVRGKADIAVALRAEQRLKECREQVPGAKINVFIREDEAVKDSDWDRLHRDAASAGVEIAL